MAARIFLGVMALVWGPYGIYLIFSPTFLADAAQVVATGTTGTHELRAMYGGLQTAIAVLSALGCASPRWRRHALVTNAFLCTGLGLARLTGVALDGEVSGYTTGALIFEFAAASCSMALIRSSPAPVAP